VSAVAEGIKLVIVLVDNEGYASIGALSRSVGSGGFGTRYGHWNGSLGLDGDPGQPLDVDLAANAESLGARVLRADGLDALRGALDEARAHTGGPVVVHVRTDRYAGVPDYESWWDVPVAEVSEDPEVRAARERYEAARAAQRAYVRPA
jgi:3D-(3,5/4)-trihydroxycyclohexane-1,2-dione acylhydrolase (decyclizing)